MDVQDSTIVPNSGMIVPRMGRRLQPPGLASVLFTPVQQRVLGLLFGQPERTFQSAELIRLARGGTGAVHRQLARLEAAGLLTVTRTGNQKHYRARRDSPIFSELHGLILKTVGLTEPLRAALAGCRDDIRAAFVFGSVARGADKATSDVDLMILSDTLVHADVFESLAKAEATLGRRVNPTLMTLADWHAKRRRPDSFAARVAAQPKLFVLGSPDDID
jgi:predicted nucleotidyltransferase